MLDEIFRRVVTWFAPILCFTMEEAWLLRFPGENDSVHLQTFPETPAGWADHALIEKWNRIRALRRVVTGALEIARRDKVIGASLEAAPVLYVSDARDANLFDTVDLAEIAITSGAARPPGGGAAGRVHAAGRARRGRRLPARRRAQMRALLDGPAGSGHRAGA